MRLRTLSKLLVLGGTVVLAYKHRDRLLGTTARRTNELSPELEPDPSDPVQTFDEAPDLLVSDLSVDAIDAADVEAAQDLATLESDLDATSLDSDVTGQLDFDSAELAVEETGELYGVHTPRAVDNALPSDRMAMDDGQNWLEALETSAVEFGAEPEADLDVMDEQDVAPHPSDTRDIPVADRGSGGPAGV